MIQAYPTKKGTGVAIYGDYGDLANLYETVHKVANTLDGYNIRTKSQNQLLMNFAYDIRKAYSGDRLIDNVSFNGEEKLKYYGFQVVWTDILIFISTLRHNAGYTNTDKLDQALMYMLEYVVEKALFDYDPQGANNIQHFIGQRIDIANPLSFLIYQSLHIKYVTSPGGKRRFREIPNMLISHFSENGFDYREVKRSFEKSAQEQNCEVTDLEFADFPDIQW